jgi:hypothetical protein
MLRKQNSCAVGGTTFPRYEIGDLQTFDELIMTVDKDVWNLAGYHPSWELGVTWPQFEPN